MTSEKLRQQLTATESNRLSRAEIEQFLGERRNGCLGTVMPLGQVHLTPVWFWYENSAAYFLLGSGRVHLANLRLSPIATLMVEEDLRLKLGWHGGARAVMIRGRVVEITDPNECARISAEIDRKYLGDDADNTEFREASGSDTYALWTLAAQRTVSWRLG
jgi:nitroimidazol reductase NimA-like FMN-containing flavoprotein (pyridoxamine 5'-phosphate oxidase superfamily)